MDRFKKPDNRNSGAHDQWGMDGLRTNISRNPDRPVACSLSQFRNEHFVDNAALWWVFLEDATDGYIKSSRKRCRKVVA